MTDIIQTIQELPPSAIFGYVVGIFGIIAGFYTIVSYYQSRRGQKPKYMVLTSIFQSKSIENSSIEIRHSGRVIQDFSISMLALWNDGTTIKREDIATKAPFHLIAIEGAEILEVHLLFSEKKNDVTYSLSADKKNIDIDFEYLAHNDGLVMKVFHTGTSPGALKIGGSLTSGRDLKKSEGHMVKLAKLFAGHLSLRSFRRIMGWLVILMGTVGMVEAIVSYVLQIPIVNGSLIGIIAQLALYLFFIVYAYRTLVRSRLPKKLEKYFYSE